MILFIIYLILIFILNNFLKKLNLLTSYSGSNHQKFANEAVTLSGGIFIFIPFLFIFFEFNLIFVICTSLLFLLGLLSDTNILDKPKLRLILQFIILTYFVLSLKIEVLPTRIDFIDNNFQNTYLSYFFTLFCLLILINGSNFIDGLNGLLLGYLILILFFIIKLDMASYIYIDYLKFNYFIFLLLFILVLNFLNLLFLGDSGSYSISFIVGYFLIIIYNKATFVSPYFIILLLWYPCFENLFSIIRKNVYKNDPLKADNKHLHHYLYIFLKSKFKISNLIANNLTSIIINLFNLIIFYIGSKYNTLTYVQFILIFICITFYLIIYFFLKKKVNSQKINIL